MEGDPLAVGEAGLRAGDLVSLGAIVSVDTSVQPQRLQRFQQRNSATLSLAPWPEVTNETAVTLPWSR